MAGTSPTRIDADIADAAKVAGAVMSRSAAQQVNHWARIGRELESSHTVSQRDIAKVLAGRASYDALNVHEQALVRAEWKERTTALREGLNLAEELTAAGESWVDAATDGQIVERTPQVTAAKRRPRARAKAG